MKPCGRFSANILADFRPRLWPIFGQSFWSVFGQNFGRFPTKKKSTWIAPMGLGEPPSDATLALAILFGKPFQFSRGAFPNLRAKPFIFYRKLKSESKSGHVFWSKSGQRNLMPRSPDCEPARILCHCGQFSATIFWSVFGHDFGPQTPDRNRTTPWPKSENGQAEIGKRPFKFSENAKAKIQK